MAQMATKIHMVSIAPRASMASKDCIALSVKSLYSLKGEYGNDSYGLRGLYDLKLKSLFREVLIQEKKSCEFSQLWS